MERITLTYGILPDDLKERCLESAPYRIGVHSNSDDGEAVYTAIESLSDLRYVLSTDNAGRDVFSFDATNLVRFIKALVQIWEEDYEANENSGSLVSSILETMNVEWV